MHGRSGDDQRPGLDEFAPAGLHDRPRLAGPAANFDTCPGKAEQSLYRPEVADLDGPRQSLGANAGATRANDFPRQADECGQVNGGHARSRTDLDGTERDAGTYGLEGPSRVPDEMLDREFSQQLADNTAGIATWLNVLELVRGADLT